MRSSGKTTIEISASTEAGVPGAAINTVMPSPVILPNGGKATLLVPFKSLPNLANNSYFITATVTDSLGDTSSASTTGTTSIAAPFVTLALAFGSIPKTVLASGATLTLTNSGNSDDTSAFTATVGLATDSAGVNVVATAPGTIVPATLTVRASKTAAIHVKGWSQLQSQVSAGTYFLTVRLTDANGNTASTVFSSEVAG